MLRPTDAAEARFEIESVRLVWRREHLSEIPSGVAWHGQGEVWRETAVSRAPERLEFDVELPNSPARFEVALGIPGWTPVTFGIEVTPRDGPDEPITHTQHRDQATGWWKRSRWTCRRWADAPRPSRCR